MNAYNILLLHLKRAMVLAVAGIIIFSIVATPRAARALMVECGITIAPSSVLPGSSTSFRLDIVNNDPINDIQWIRVLRPSAEFTIQSATGGLWSSLVAPEEVTFTGDVIVPGASGTFYIQAAASNVESGAAGWSVYVSDSPDGSGSVGCSGQNMTEISSQQPFQINNVLASSITSSKSTISWTTNRPGDTKVEYGTTTLYGKVLVDNSGNFSTDHALTLTNLSPSTVYHYRAVSTSQDGQTVRSADGTFLTANAIIKPSVPTNPVIPNTAPAESIPPQIIFPKIFKYVYQDTPKFEGEVFDNVAILNIEYSTDGGQNWLPVDSAPGLGRGYSGFAFTPKNLLDGNYEIVVRATDTSKNTSFKKWGTVIIDKLPPIVGGNAMSVGMQSIIADSDGTMRALAGTDQRIVLGAVGGATSINITAYSLGGNVEVQNFGLSKSSNTGLWTGALSFSKGGIYNLRVHAIDGAGNRTNKILGTIIVRDQGKILDNKTGGSVQAEVSVYAKNPKTQAWVLWSADNYGQRNPMKSKQDGTYGMFLPQGTYYLKVRKQGYYTATSQSFTLATPGSVSSEIKLKPARGLNIGSFNLHIPRFDITRITLDNKLKKPKNIGTSKDITLPNFNLSQTDGSTIRTVDLFGRPAVISLISSWSTLSQSQLPVLADLAREYPELKITPVSSGESLSSLISQSVLANYGIPIAADINNSLISGMGGSNTPTHYFLNRRGIVTKQVTGVLSKQELLQYVSN